MHSTRKLWAVLGLMLFSLRLVPAHAEWDDKSAPVGAPAKEPSGA
jgi:hypothetical protein